MLVYTDDTAMALGIAESLMKRGRLEERDLGDTFRENFKQEPWRGYATGPPTIFVLVEKEKIPYAEAAQRIFNGEGSFGNGAAMRVGPVGLFFHDAGDLYEQARKSAVVTHAHPLGVDGAAVLACAVARAVQLLPREPFPLERFVDELIACSRTTEMKQKMQQVKSLLGKDAPPQEAAGILGRTVAVHESQPFAIYSFLRNPMSYEDCLFCSILNGGDRDTLGAMACSISGAYLGLEAIPRFWRMKLENHEPIVELARKLLARRSG